MLIVWAFAIVCVGTYFFLPDMKASLGQVGTTSLSHNPKLTPLRLPLQVDTHLPGGAEVGGVHGMQHV